MVTQDRWQGLEPLRQAFADAGWNPDTDDVVVKWNPDAKDAHEAAYVEVTIPLKSGVATFWTYVNEHLTTFTVGGYATLNGLTQYELRDLPNELKVPGITRDEFLSVLEDYEIGA